VIGGGSGGLACAKRAAGYGASVAVIEGSRYGGTCVNVGCVPKKVMFNASHVMESIRHAKEFGITVGEVSFDWAKLKQYRDRYISRLNTIYESGLDKLKITRIAGFASFVDANTLLIDQGPVRVRGEKIVIASGGTPSKLSIPGGEFAIDSDGFFALETQPRKVAVIGSGYIAVELSGVLNELGTDTSIFVRENSVLRTFDPMIQAHLVKSMQKHGPKLFCHHVPHHIEKHEDGTFSIDFTNGKSESGFDCIVSAIGRTPLTTGLNLPAANIASNNRGYVIVDEYQNTSASSVFALGDVAGTVELTPMAIAAGRKLADRLFGGIPAAKADYDFVPTVVFSHPTIGTCGLTEPRAIELYGSENIKIYTSDFVNLFYGTFFEGNAGDKPITKYKVICLGPEERVIGLHLIGMSSDEVLQGFGVAMKMGATKADFDRCVAIHPTAGEELVTLAPWGMSGVSSQK
jgi:glutathione reductase (NADPH)